MLLVENNDPEGAVEVELFPVENNEGVGVEEVFEVESAGLDVKEKEGVAEVVSAGLEVKEKDGPAVEAVAVAVEAVADGVVELAPKENLGVLEVGSFVNEKVAGLESDGGDSNFCASLR